MRYHRKKGFPVNEGFFDAPFSEEAAYMLGFIAGDGWINGNTFAITLAEKDKRHLDKLKAAIGSEHNIYLRVRKGKRYYQWKVGSKTLTKRLESLGITPNKSKTMDPSKILKKLRRSLHPHFFRGLVDADGWISKPGANPKIGLTGSKLACEAFLHFVRARGVNTQTTIRKKASGDCYVVAFSGARLGKSVCRILYSKSNLYLDRKKERAQAITGGVR